MKTKVVFKKRRLPKENEYRILVRLPLDYAELLQKKVDQMTAQLNMGKPYSINLVIKDAIKEWLKC
jgi:hypothetical protein